MSELFDGLTREEAIRICVRRSDELSGSQRDFVRAIGNREKPLNRAQALRLTAIMEKFRQDDLVSYLGGTSGGAGG